jgi:ribonuclease HII
MKVTIGVDEAGRGPAIGPMVMAVVALEPRGAAALTRAGVRDSKAFGSSEDGRRMRAALAARVRERALHVELRVVDVPQIDERVRKNELNVLEREIATELIVAAPAAHRIVADGRTLFSRLRDQFPHLEAHDHGESRHCAVAAASIVAKVRRDELFAAIAARYLDEFGAIGGLGYVNAATRRFLRAYVRKHGCLPPEARRTWPYHYLSGLLRAPTSS